MSDNPIDLSQQAGLQDYLHDYLLVLLSGDFDKYPHIFGDGTEERKVLSDAGIVVNESEWTSEHHLGRIYILHIPSGRCI